MKMKHVIKCKLFFSVFLIFVLSATLFAQETFEDWEKQYNKDFQAFKDARDKEFYTFLKQRWIQIHPENGDTVKARPKPNVVPKFRERPLATQKRDSLLQRSKRRVTSTELTQRFKKEKPQRKKHVIIPKKAKHFSFFSTDITWYGGNKLNLPRLTTINKQAALQFWKQINSNHLEDILRQVKGIKDRMLLNDWGYTLLIKEVAAQIFSVAKNQINLFSWALLLKSGYKVKFGYNENGSYLLLPSGIEIFQVAFLIEKKQRYYIFSFENNAKAPKHLMTYHDNYSSAEKIIDFKVLVPPAFNDNFVEKSINFKYHSEKYLLKIKYNQSLIEFYRNYPQTKLKYYFQTPLSDQTYNRLLKVLEPLIINKTKMEAANILLRFVQNAAGYETDQQQFGREKYFFAEESLYYPFFDCEDRSILYAYLVRNLLGLDVIALDYPSHITTAVHFDNNLPGDAIQYAGKKYLICDPTYIGADIGMNMPVNKKLIPKIINLRL